jgi:WD40 repeat protein
MRIRSTGWRLASGMLGVVAFFGSAHAQTPRLVVPIGHTSLVTSVRFSPDGKRLLTTAEDGTAKIWDAQSGRELRTLVVGASVCCGSFSPDGRRVTTASYDKIARIWDVSSGRLLISLTGHRGAVNSVAFSPDGSHLVTGSGDKAAIVWNGITGKSEFVLRSHTDIVQDVSFSPDGSYSRSRRARWRAWSAARWAPSRPLKRLR